MRQGIAIAETRSTRQSTIIIRVYIQHIYQQNYPHYNFLLLTKPFLIPVNSPP